MAYTKRYALGFNDSGPSGGTGADSQFLNNVEAALLALLGVDATADGQALLWKAANSRYEPALIKNANIDPAAAIARSKLGALNIADADIVGGANIAKSKLAALNIGDADVASISVGKITGLSTPPGTEIGFGQITASPAQVTATTEATGKTVNGTGLKGAVTVTIASPAVFSFVAHGLQVGDAIALSTTGALPTGLSERTLYYVIAAGFGADSFQVATTPGGSAVNTSGVQSGTHTLYKAQTYDGSKVFVRAYFPAAIGTTTSSKLFVSLIRDDGAVIGHSTIMATTNETGPVIAEGFDIPAAGLHAYFVVLWVSAAVTAEAGAGGATNLLPAYIRATRA